MGVAGVDVKCFGPKEMLWAETGNFGHGFENVVGCMHAEYHIIRKYTCKRTWALKQITMQASLVGAPCD